VVLVKQIWLDCWRSLPEVISSQEIVSKIVDGKRSIDAIQAKALSEYFQVSASLFL
jgi:antitoxin component HigA of HigAB toxin-antitoxin module